MEIYVLTSALVAVVLCWSAFILLLANRFASRKVDRLLREQRDALTERIVDTETTLARKISKIEGGFEVKSSDPGVFKCPGATGGGHHKYPAYDEVVYLGPVDDGN